MGLGSFTLAVWLGKYRWYFLSATVVFLAIALYKSLKNWRNISAWSKRLISGTTILCVGLIVYSLLTAK